MYIVGQEETVGESSVSVVAGVRTVTTNMDGRDVLPRLSRPFAFLKPFQLQPIPDRTNVIRDAEAFTVARVLKLP